jgi:hypothetical protein
MMVSVAMLTTLGMTRSTASTVASRRASDSFARDKNGNIARARQKAASDPRQARLVKTPRTFDNFIVNSTDRLPVCSIIRFVKALKTRVFSTVHHL